MTRSMLALITVTAAFLVASGVAQADPVPFNPVMLDGKRVTVRLVGGISAVPCNRTRGCGQGIVSLRWGGVEVADHHVRCLRPQNLHTVRSHQGARHAFAFVFACGKTYRWMLR